MAGKRKPNKGCFKKGQSGNPAGSSSLARDPERQRIKRLVAGDLEEIGSLILCGNFDRLKEVVDDRGASVIQTAFARCFAKALQDADWRTVTSILDRVVGKAKETVELSGRDGKPMSLEVAQREMTEAEMRERADALAKQRMEAGDD
jgi:hypothetical protein